MKGTDLTTRLNVDERVRNVLGMLRIGETLYNALLPILKDVQPYDQMFLTQLVAWRIAGGHLPVGGELIHFPLLRDLSFSKIEASANRLLEIGWIEVQQVPGVEVPKRYEFIWPNLERLIVEAAEDARRPVIVGLDGVTPINR